MNTVQSITCKKESPAHWVDVAVSTNGRAVALVDKEGYLWGGSSDFKVNPLCIYMYVFLLVKPKNI